MGELVFVLGYLEDKRREFVVSSQIWRAKDEQAKTILLKALLYRWVQDVKEDALAPSYLFAANDPIVRVDHLGLLAIHGRWCGPNWTGGEAEASYDYDWLGDLMDDGAYEVVDEVDSCCFYHDACCADINDPFDYSELLAPLWSGGCSAECNDTLCDCVTAVTPESDAERSARSRIRCWFCGAGPGNWSS